MMKKIALATIAATTLATAGAAAAQPYGYGYNNGYQNNGYGHRWDDADSINRRQAAIDQRIEWGIRNGSLTGREASALREESRDLARLEARLRWNGLTPYERRDLDRRLDRLQDHLAQQMRDGDRRWDRDDEYRRW